MTTQLPIQTVFDASGQAVSVLVPIELWRQIEAQFEPAPTELEARAKIWSDLKGSLAGKLGGVDEFLAEKHAEVEREIAREDARGS